MKETEKCDTAPERQRYSTIEIYRKYKKALKSEYPRYEFEDIGLSQLEMWDLIEIISIINDVKGGLDE